MASELEEKVRAENSGADVDAFANKAVSDIASHLVALHCAIGDRLGLFKALAARGAITPQELAAVTGTNARYVEEWAKCLMCAGYLSHDGGRFGLPPAAVPVLAEEGGPAFLGGFYQQLGAFLRVYDRVTDAFRQGGGVPAESFHIDLWEGEERANNMWHENLLVQDWIPRLPEVKAKLEAGADVVDVGCGMGRALINLAKAFPKSRFTGYDVLPDVVATARKAAAAEGVGDRLRFEVIDVTHGIQGTYDIATAFDVVHDVQDPPKLLRDIRRVLRPGGRFMIMELNVADDLAANAGPLGALLYGVSPFYCMTISLARGGLGYGTAGMPPGRLRELSEKAGFRDFRRVDVGSPIQVLYELGA